MDLLNIKEKLETIHTFSGKNGRRTCLYLEQKISYDIFVSRIGKLTSYFRNSDLQPGDRALLFTTNDEALITIFWALLCNGITSVVIDPDTKTNRLRSIIDQVQPQALFRDDKKQIDTTSKNMKIDLKISSEENSVTSLKSILFKNKKSSSQNKFPGLFQDLEVIEPTYDLELNNTAYILYTSGTTSAPKGIEITYRNLFSHLETLSSQYGLNASSRILNILPLYHADGLIEGPLLTLYNQAALYRPCKFNIGNIPTILDAVYKYRITHFITVPTMLNLLQELGSEYFDSLRSADLQMIISAAGQLLPELWKKIEALSGKRLVNVYGLTETVAGGLYSGPDDETYKLGTIGKPIDCQVRLVKNDGTEASSGETGELWLKGDNVMKGYFAAPRDTAQILKDGWLMTGDIAFCDPEGFYHFSGRNKSAINSGGLIVFPEEISEVIAQHPRVRENLVFGVPDKIYEEKIVGCAVSLDENLTEKELINFCRDHLEAYKIPNRIHFFEELPKGPTGKVQIQELKKEIDRMQKRKLEGSADLDSQLFKLAADCFKISSSELTPASKYQETTGWDSLAHLELIAAVEEAFQITLSTDEIMKINTIQDLISIVGEKNV